MEAPGRPWRSNEERLLDETLMAQTVPGAMLANVRPPLPQIDPWRPRLGYGDSASRQPTIYDVINVDRWLPDNAASFSGGVGSYSGTQRPGLGNSDMPSGPNPY
jgi:hypothetical protein